MKKLYLLTLVAVLLASTVSAQTTWRKSWDFTKWSAATVANLKADNAKVPYTSNTTKEWSDAEKKEATEPTDLSKDNCFWKWGTQGTAESTDFLKANDIVITELEGLYYTNVDGGALAIAVNYQGPVGGEGFGPYHGASYLWLGGSNKNYFVIPHVPVGETIKMGVESHNLTSARGVKLYLGRGNSGAELKDPDGNDVAVPTTYQEQIWQVPADAEATNDDGTVDVTIRNTNGCHLYFITVGDGGNPVQEAKKVAFVGGADDMMLIAMQSAPDRIDATLVDAASDFTLADLQADYEAVIVSPEIAADSKAVSVLKSAVAYMPMVNLSAALYEAWGFGSAVASDAAALTLTEAYKDDESFASLAGEGLLADGQFSAVTLGSYFAADAVIANAGDAVAVHAHNPGRNTYLGMPLSANALPADPIFIIDAVEYVAKTKKSVSNVATPEFTQKNGNLATEVSISCSTANSTIYYTLDGTDPTVASQVYETPFTLTDAKTVKAFATADGYLPSAVASAEVAIFAQTAAPVFTMTKEATSTTVEIASATDGAKVYFSFLPFTEVSKAQEYTAPIVLSQEPTPIYAMATAANCVPSELVDDYVAINSINANTIRIDTVAHFTANQAAWLDGLTEKDDASTGDTKTFYYFGKKAWAHFSEEVDHTEIVKGSEGQDSTVTYYKADPAAKKVATSTTDKEWRLTTAGQVLIWQNTAPGGQVATLKSETEASGYDAMTAEDLIGGAPSKHNIQFSSKNSGDPYTAAIESVNKFTAPFDVVSYIASSGANSNAKVALEISADGNTWEEVGDFNISKAKRGYKKTRIPVEKEGDWYVRVAQKSGSTGSMIFDIYVLNNGEISKKYEVPAGIEDITSESAEVISVEIYNLNGIRLAEPATGVNIIRTVYSDGTVKTEKVLNR